MSSEIHVRIHSKYARNTAEYSRIQRILVDPRNLVI